MTFEECLAFTLPHEGGDKFTNDPNDPGGPTKYGIAGNYHPGVDIEHLTFDGAAAIFRKEYWDACHCDELPALLRLPVFDAAVNPGQGASIQFLQRSLGVPVDGAIGPQTLRAAQSASVNTVKQVIAERIVYYGSRDGFPRNGRGWVVRCLDLQATVVLAQFGALGPVFPAKP